VSRWPGNARHQATTFGQLSRAELMSRVRSRGNVTTELRAVALLRRARLTGWRRHLPLPGRPDFAWSRERVALFVDGCFWHGHGCKRNLTPRRNADAWRAKINSNRSRDRRTNRILRSLGWTVVRIWECDLGKFPDKLGKRIETAVRQGSTTRSKAFAITTELLR
jgi:DNA mismatch endonuclease (patch repair protein)